jgi:hypothetical protein
VEDWQEPGGVIAGIGGGGAVFPSLGGAVAQGVTG